MTTTCPRCGYVVAWGGTTIRCLSPRCTFERTITETARRRLVADVVGRLPRRSAQKGRR